MKLLLAIILFVAAFSVGAQTMVNPYQALHPIMKDRTNRNAPTSLDQYPSEKADLEGTAPKPRPARPAALPPAQPAQPAKPAESLPGSMPAWPLPRSACSARSMESKADFTLLISARKWSFRWPSSLFATRRAFKSVPPPKRASRSRPMTPRKSRCWPQISMPLI